MPLGRVSCTFLPKIERSNTERNFSHSNFLWHIRQQESPFRIQSLFNIPSGSEKKVFLRRSILSSPSGINAFRWGETSSQLLQLLCSQIAKTFVQLLVLRIRISMGMEWKGPHWRRQVHFLVLPQLPSCLPPEFHWDPVISYVPSLHVKAKMVGVMRPIWSLTLVNSGVLRCTLSQPPNAVFLRLWQRAQTSEMIQFYSDLAPWVPVCTHTSNVMRTLYFHAGGIRV